MSDPADETPPPSTGTVDEASLQPVTRDRRFLVRLALLAAVATGAATFVGAKLQRAAGACGASLLRPGSTVIPAERNGDPPGP
ncbi:MAG: hypothetical protein U0325_17985 [Polyangiales bacterium]